MIQLTMRRDELQLRGLMIEIFRNACGSSLDGCSTQSPCYYVFLSYSCNGALPCRTRNRSYPQVISLTTLRLRPAPAFNIRRTPAAGSYRASGLVLWHEHNQVLPVMDRQLGVGGLRLARYGRPDRHIHLHARLDVLGQAGAAT